MPTRQQQIRTEVTNVTASQSQTRGEMARAGIRRTTEVFKALNREKQIKRRQRRDRDAGETKRKIEVALARGSKVAGVAIEAAKRKPDVTLVHPQVASSRKGSTTLPDGWIVPTRDLGRIKSSSPDLYQVIMSRGYRAYLSAIPKTRGYVELPGEDKTKPVFVSKRSLEQLRRDSPRAYDLLRKDGYDAYKRELDGIKARRTYLSKFKDPKGKIDTVEAMKSFIRYQYANRWKWGKEWTQKYGIPPDTNIYQWMLREVGATPAEARRITKAAEAILYYEDLPTSKKETETRKNLREGFLKAKYVGTKGNRYLLPESKMPELKTPFIPNVSRLTPERGIRQSSRPSRSRAVIPHYKVMPLKTPRGSDGRYLGMGVYQRGRRRHIGLD